MKRVCLVSLLVTAALAARALPARAQLLCALGPVTKPYDATSDAGPPATLQADIKRVRAALCAKGCGRVLLVVNPTAPDAVTATTGLGVSQIAFSPQFLNALHAGYGPNAALGIVAHEVGHHLDAVGDHPSWMKPTWDVEQRADAWAGCALGKTDLKPAALQIVLSAMAAYPPAARPSWTARRPAVEAGYAQCTGGHSLPALPEAPKKEAAEGGCATDHDCRNGRVCLSGHCGLPAAHKRCGKDTDCPEPQECGTDGTCQTPPGAENAHPPAATAAAPPPDPAACQKSCDDPRDRCVEAATSARDKCLAAITAEANYRACTCPQYPEGNYGCYTYCSDAYQRGNACLAEKKTAACQAEDAACRARCKDAASAAAH
ncbi:MAG TPA: hypothetical protein VN962_23705 [Polyangia bacterium]|nr:hypothetical protein [Polyangia bacterium]